MCESNVQLLQNNIATRIHTGHWIYVKRETKREIEHICVWRRRKEWNESRRRREKEMSLYQRTRRWSRWKERKKKERDGPGRRPDDGCATYGSGGEREWRLLRVTLELGARRDAMTYRPRSPRALTSRSRPESDWEHVNSTPAITRSRPDRAALIGRPSTSPSPRLVAPARPAWSRIRGAGAGRLAFSELAPTWESFIAPRDVRPLRYCGDLHFCQRGLGARYTLFFLFLWLFERCVLIVFFFLSLGSPSYGSSSCLRGHGHKSGTSLAASLAPAEARKWQRIKYTATTLSAVARETQTSSTNSLL